MKESKRKKLEEQGWKIGNTDEFLKLTPEESAFVEIKLILSKDLHQKDELGTKNDSNRISKTN
ncbi:MAG: hypothetical protein MZV64_50690 [Ignavibacteriales bacterium]|nr:hypothetical protein [Ignavibacteriales bacterium]